MLKSWNINASNSRRTLSTVISARYRSNRRFQMNHRLATALGVAALAIVLTAIFLAPTVTAGQVKEGVNAVTIAAPKTNAKPWVLKKTPDGQPDLQGYWTNNSIIPLQRPNGVTKEFYTQEEFLAKAKQQGTQDAQHNWRCALRLHSIWSG